MASNFPTSLDDASGVGSGTGPVPATTDTTDSPSHAALHQKTGDAVVAVESKVGTGASTPTANTVLGGTGSGTSAWGTVSNAQIASGVDASKLTTGTLPTARLDTVAFEGALSSSQAVTNINLSNVLLTNEITDTHNAHPASSASWACPTGEDGWYLVGFRYIFETGTTGLFGRIVVGSDSYWAPGTTNNPGGSISVLASVTAGQLIYSSVQHSTGSTKNLTAATLTILRLR